MSANALSNAMGEISRMPLVADISCPHERRLIIRVNGQIEKVRSDVGQVLLRYGLRNVIPDIRSIHAPADKTASGLTPADEMDLLDRVL